MLDFLYSIRKGVSNFTLLKRLYLTLLRFFPVHYRYQINRKLRSPFSQLEENNNIIFIHIPKAAGNALIKSLYRQSATGHDPILRYKQFDIIKFNNSYKFAVVRNPWDRFVSAFHYLKQGGIGFFDQDFASQYLDDVVDFRAFVKKLESDNNYRTKILSWVHFVPQVDFLCDEKGVFLLDNIIKLEEINKEIIPLCKDLGLTRQTMIKFNASKRKPYKNYYNKELTAIVARLYKQDIERLGYSFE